MKNYIVLTIFVLLFFSCKKEQNIIKIEKTKTDTSLVNIPEEKIDTDTVEKSSESDYVEEQEKYSINFKKFNVSVDQKFDKAPLNWSSNSHAKTFKTRIIDAYKSDKIDFAGHYIGVLFGCGAGCVMGYMIDVRDGNIYDAPLGEENSCFYNQEYALCQDDSLLFISAICRENEESDKLFYTGYLWDEDQKVFKEIDSKEFLFK